MEFWLWGRPDAGLGILGAVFGIQGLEESVGPTFETLVPEILVCQGLDSEFRIMNARTLLSSPGIEIRNSEFGSLEVQIQDSEFWIYMVRSGIAFRFSDLESGPPDAGPLLRACLETSAQISRNRSLALYKMVCA